MLGPGVGVGPGLVGGRGGEPPAPGVPPVCCAGPKPSFASRAAAPEGSGLPQARAASTAPSPIALGPASLRPSSVPRTLQAEVVAAVFGLPFTLSTTVPVAAPRGRAIATAALPWDADPSTITPFGADFTVMRWAPLTTVIVVWASAGAWSESGLAKAAVPESRNAAKVRGRRRRIGRR